MKQIAMVQKFASLALAMISDTHRDDDLYPFHGDCFLH